MSKIVVGVGGALLTVGAGLLLTYTEPTHAQAINPYGGDLAGDAQKYGGWICLGVGVLMLVIGLVRVLKAPRHDPDLPPQYRV